MDREPLGDYPSALAKAKLLAVEKSEHRIRQRQPESRTLSTERERRALTDIASTQGLKHETNFSPPSLQDRSGAAVVKHEPKIEPPSPRHIPESSHFDGASKPNQYAGLVSAKKRKREQQSPAPARATVKRAPEQLQALPNRPFAPLKKPVRGARPPYEDV